MCFIVQGTGFGKLCSSAQPKSKVRYDHLVLELANGSHGLKHILYYTIETLVSQLTYERGQAKVRYKCVKECTGKVK